MFLLPPPRIRSVLVLFVLCLVGGGCGGDDAATHHAADASVDAYASKCGKPGDTGNDLGLLVDELKVSAGPGGAEPHDFRWFAVIVALFGR